MMETRDQLNPELPIQAIASGGRFFCAALQQLQALFGTEPSALCDPSLADLVDFINAVQLDFGRHASLELVIQMFVAEDLAHQLTEDLARQRTMGQRRQQAPDIASQVVSIAPCLPEVLAS